MAIGMAQLFGFHFLTNFRRPYLASSITDFWHRWHISLSSWLRDYLYIPLGGSRNGELRTYRNLIITMLLGGLWHGASWNFVIWGGYHGILLSVERAFRRPFRKDKSPSRRSSKLLYPIRAILTFALVTIGWVFFRAANLKDSTYVISQMFSGPAGSRLIPAWELYMILITLLLALIEERHGWFNRVVVAPAWVYGSVCAMLLLVIELIGYTEAAVPFVYFQF